MNNTVFLRYQQISSEWDSEKNGSLKPEDFSPGSQKSVWWICDKGHSYQARISCRTGAGNRIPTGCPYCCGKKVLKGFNDLASLHPEDYEFFFCFSYSPKRKTQTIEYLFKTLLFLSR